MNPAEADPAMASPGASPQIRRRRLLHQRRDRFVEAHHLLPLLAQPAHRDGAGLDLLAADRQDRRDMGGGVLATFLLIFSLRVSASARSPAARNFATTASA